MKVRPLAVAGTALALTVLTMLPVCDQVFGCGCTWPFLGAADHCNIHNPQPPHCPLCANWALGGLFGAALFAAWAGAIGLLARVVRPPAAR